jgi:hypothetical protein
MTHLFLGDAENDSLPVEDILTPLFWHLRPAQRPSRIEILNHQGMFDLGRHGQQKNHIIVPGKSG